MKAVKIAELVADLVCDYRMRGKEVFAADTETRWNLHLRDWFAALPAPSLSTQLMNEYRMTRLSEKAAQATINRELQILRRAYKLAEESTPPKVLRLPRFKFPKEDNARQGFFNEDQLARIRAAADVEGLWARVFVEAAFLWGWRRGEILGLLVEDVDLTEGVVRLKRSKNGEAREIPLTHGLAAMLKELTYGKAATDRVFPIRHIRSPWRRICKTAGVKRLVHDFRRTAARTKRAAGIDTSVIMAIQGWKSEAMFRRYAIVDRKDKLEALRKVAS